MEKKKGKEKKFNCPYFESGQIDFDTSAMDRTESQKEYGDHIVEDGIEENYNEDYD